VTINDVPIGPWLTAGAAILAAGMWLGSLQQRVNQIEATQQYYHGVVLPAALAK
jgi:hypothetical protein